MARQRSSAAARARRGDTHDRPATRLLPGIVLLVALLALFGIGQVPQAAAIPLEADLGITKTDGVTTATPGGSVTYTITASNAGPDGVTGATVADTFPASLTATWTCVGAGGGTCTASGSGNINDSVNLPVGGSVTYTATAAISASATGTLSNTATVTASATDPNPANNSATDTDTLTPQADLGITKTDGVTTATAGGSVTYTITASNAGPSNASGATVADTFPASLTANWTCVGAGGGTCTASGSGNINDTVNLPAGGSVTYTATATISPLATGTLSNTATVTAPGGVTDPNPTNNSATDSDTLAAGPTATNDVYSAQPGVPLVVPAPGVLGNDNEPNGRTLTAVLVTGPANGTLTLNPNGSFTYLTSSNFIGLDSFTYQANNGTASSAPATVNINVFPPPPIDLGITKTDGVTVVAAGSTVTYTITVTNFIPTPVTGATVTDILPPELLGATWTCVGFFGGTCTASGSGNINDTINLPISGGSVTYTLIATLSPAASGQLLNTATVSSTQNDTNPTNNLATDFDIINAAPIANPDGYSLPAGASLTVLAPGILTNDNDPEFSPLSAVLVSGPARGTLVLNPDGSFIYTPNAGVSGTDSFTYRASDGAALSAPTTVTLTIIGANTPPVATADSYGLSAGSPLTVPAPGVLANDTDANGDPLTAVLVSGPANGTLVLNLNGSFTYTPASGYSGTDSFTYRANDGTTLSADAVVTLTIASTNAAPVANADSYGTTKNTALTIAAPGVLANDTDADGNPLTAALVSGPANGTVTLSPNGSFTYTPASGYAGRDTFTYRATDGTALSATATVTIQIGDTATLTLRVEGPGTVSANPASGAQPVGTVVTLTPQAQGGALFAGWIVDDRPAGWANPLALTLDRDHTVVARFAPPAAFSDLPANDPAATAIAELTARGIINGYGDGTFGPADNLSRAQASALVVRALGWSGESYPNPFTDRGTTDDDLWRSVGILAHYNVARGYGDGTFDPAGKVNHAEYISLVTRAMVAKGYWVQQPDDANRIPALAGTDHRRDAITFAFYVGSFPELTEGSTAALWYGEASRGWAARALWAAIDQYQRVDRVP